MNKRYVLITLICISIPVLIAQEYKYHPFPVFEDKPLWVLREAYYENPNPTVSYICIFLTKDTLIHEQVFYKVELIQYKGEDFDKSNAKNHEYPGYYRVDNDNKKVYFLNDIIGEYLMFDFSLEEGDSVIVENDDNYCYVYKIDTFQINNTLFKGGLRKMLCTTSGEWIEGYGRSEYVFPHIYGYYFSIPETSIFPNFCFWLGDTLVSPNINDYDTTIYPHPGLLYKDTPLVVFDNKETELKIFPNPVDELIKIVWDKPGFAILQLLDANGRQIKIMDVSRCENAELKTKGYPPGIYFFKLTGKDGRQVTQKIIIQ